MNYWGLSHKACLSAAQELSSGIHYPGFYVLKRWKRVQLLYVEGKYYLTLYKGSEVEEKSHTAQRQEGLSEPLSHFYSCPMTGKQSLSCLSSIMTDRGQVPLLHCTDP